MKSWKWEIVFVQFTMISNEWQDIDSAIKSLRMMEQAIGMPAIRKEIVAKNGEKILFDLPE